MNMTTMAIDIIGISLNLSAWYGKSVLLQDENVFGIDESTTYPKTCSKL